MHRWATTLSDVYLRGSLDRALVSRTETVAHRRAVAQAVASRDRVGAATALDPFALIINHDSNPRALDLSGFTKAQLVAFIVTAVEVRQARTGKARRRQRNSRAS